MRTINTIIRAGSRCRHSVNFYSYSWEATAAITKHVNNVSLDAITSRAFSQCSVFNKVGYILTSYNLTCPRLDITNRLDNDSCVGVTRLKLYPRNISQEYNIKRNFLISSRLQIASNKSHTAGSSANVKSNEMKSSQSPGPIHENISTIPNWLCLSRIVASPYLAHVIINNADFSWALVIFAYAGLTDLVSYFAIALSKIWHKLFMKHDNMSIMQSYICSIFF